MENLDVNTAIWCIFLNATLRAAVHLGQDHEANLRYVKNHFWNSAKQLFRETGKLISGQTEIAGVNTIDFKDLTWMSTSLLNSRAYQYSNVKAYVVSDSVLCVGRTGDDPIATWKSKIKLYSETNYFREMNRIDGTPKEFEWKIFLGITTFGLLEKIQNLLRDSQCECENFKGRIIFMSMYNDIESDRKETKDICEHNSQAVPDYARKCPRGHWSFLGIRSEKKWYGTYSGRPDGSWDKLADQMMMNFSESGHAIFRASSAFDFERGELRSKGGGKKSIHFNGSEKTSSCFSERSLLRISSVSTEQWQICATNYPKSSGL